MADRPRRTAQTGKSDTLLKAPVPKVPTSNPKRKINSRTTAVVSTADSVRDGTSIQSTAENLIPPTEASVPDTAMDKPQKKRKAPTAKKILATSSTAAVEEGSHDADDEGLPKAKRTKAAVPPTPSKSNPSRTNRVANPGEPDKKRPKRTSAEVLADKQRKERIALELAEVEKQKILLLAAMEVEDEEAEDEELLNVVRSGDDREGSPETFLFDEVDAEPSEEEDILEDDGKKATASKAKIAKPRKKPVPGATRKAVEEAKEALREQGLKRKNLESESNPDHIAKKPKSATVTTSGLVPNWRNKAFPHVEKTPSVIEEADLVGGLDDEDAEGLAPSKGNLRAFENDFVTIDESEDEVEDVTALNPTRAKAKVPRSPIKLVTRTIKPVIAAKKPRSNMSVASSKSRSTSVVNVKEEPHALAVPSGSWSTSSARSIVPSFMNAAWAKTFLPTLYDSLGRSEKPFSHFSKGPEIVIAIQEAIDLVWVGTDYQVQWTDEVCLKAVDRLNEKRSWIGAKALELVDELFAAPQFAGNGTAIMEYAGWALRGDGPALYAQPTPIDCEACEDDPDYIEPDGIYESTFIKVIMSTFLNSTKGSRLNAKSGQPKGALATAATALDRAFSAYLTGSRIAPDPFKRSPNEDFTDEYLDGGGISAFSENRWRHLFTVWGHAASVPAHVARSGIRRKLHVGKSPAKSR